MSTLAQLKTAIILKTNRDDMGTSAALEQALADAIDRAINRYAGERFWFNYLGVASNTSAADATMTIHATLRTVDEVSYDGKLLKKRRLDEIQHLTDSGRPRVWAEADGAIHLWPIPDGTYSLTQYGLAELGTPASASSNAWTTDALDLIDASARKYLFLGYLRDPEGATMAAAEEAEALSNLRRESRRKARTRLRHDVPLSRAYIEGNA
jgi:hypothetical protein